MDEIQSTRSYTWITPVPSPNSSLRRTPPGAHPNQTELPRPRLQKVPTEPALEAARKPSTGGKGAGKETLVPGEQRESVALEVGKKRTYGDSQDGPKDKYGGNDPTNGRPLRKKFRFLTAVEVFNELAGIVNCG